MRASPSLINALAVLLLAGNVLPAAAAPIVQIQTIATFEDAPQGAPDNRYSGFSLEGHVVENGAVYFNAHGFNPDIGPFFSGFFGAFRWDGSMIDPIYMSGASIEGSEDLPLRSVHCPDRSAGFSLLNGQSNPTGTYSLSVSVNGAITEILSSGAPIPGTTRTIQSLDYGRTDGEHVWLQTYAPGDISDHSILMADTTGQGLRLLVDRASAFPVDLGAAPSINRLGEAEQGRLTFLANSDGSGANETLFTVDADGVIDTVADPTSTTTENGDLISPNFTHLAIGSISGDTVAFEGSFDPGDGRRFGLFTRDMTTGAVRTLLDTTVDFPIEYEDAPTSLYSPIIDGEDFAFIASWYRPGAGFPAAASRSIFMQIDGELHRIAGYGDVLDGRTVMDVSLGQKSFLNSEIAFLVRFMDDTEGLYFATLIPAPSAGTLLIPGVLFATRRRR